MTQSLKEQYKVGENDSYFAIFFLSARNERVSTLSIKNYYIIDKNKNEIYETSEKDIIEKGIILEDVDIFVKRKELLYMIKKEYYSFNEIGIISIDNNNFEKYIHIF